LGKVVSGGIVPVAVCQDMWVRLQVLAVGACWGFGRGESGVIRIYVSEYLGGDFRRETSTIRAVVIWQEHICGMVHV
jgi:hypothetical protein